MKLLFSFLFKIRISLQHNFKSKEIIHFYGTDKENYSTKVLYWKNTTSIIVGEKFVILVLFRVFHWGCSPPWASSPTRSRWSRYSWMHSFEKHSYERYTIHISEMHNMVVRCVITPLHLHDNVFVILAPSNCGNHC